MAWLDPVLTSSNAGWVAVRPSHSTLSRRAVEPATVVLLGQVAPGWHVIRPLFVLVEQDRDGSYVVSDDIFLVYGSGETAVEARGDYITSLVEYYAILAASDDPLDQAQFRLLREYLQPSRP